MRGVYTQRPRFQRGLFHGQGSGITIGELTKKGEIKHSPFPVQWLVNTIAIENYVEADIHTI